LELERDDIRDRIRRRIAELAGTGDSDGRAFSDDMILPAAGLLDSLQILELIVWYEHEFGLALKQSEITIDNFGSVNAMIDFLLARKPA
jgi:acyl carrier protein